MIRYLLYKLYAKLKKNTFEIFFVIHVGIFLIKFAKFL